MRGSTYREGGNPEVVNGREEGKRPTRRDICLSLFLFLFWSSGCLAFLSFILFSQLGAYGQVGRQARRAYWICYFITVITNTAQI